MYSNLYLKNQPLKVRRKIEYIFNNQYVKIVIPRKTLLFPVYEAKNEIQIGWLLTGEINIFADLLVHTTQGATGKVLEKTYEYVLLMPALLDYLDINSVKEIKQVEDITPYADIIANFNKRIINLEYVLKPKPINYFWCYEPFSLWLTTKSKALYISLPEIIGKSGDNKLFQLTKSGITFVKDNQKSFDSSEFFSGKRIRGFVAEIIGSVDVDNFFRNFNKTFYG